MSNNDSLARSIARYLHSTQSKGTIPDFNYSLNPSESMGPIGQITGMKAAGPVSWPIPNSGAVRSFDGGKSRAFGMFKSPVFSEDTRSTFSGAWNSLTAPPEYGPQTAQPINPNGSGPLPPWRTGPLPPLNWPPPGQGTPLRERPNAGVPLGPIQWPVVPNSSYSPPQQIRNGGGGPRPVAGMPKNKLPNLIWNNPSAQNAPSPLFPNADTSTPSYSAPKGMGRAPKKSTSPSN